MTIYQASIDRLTIQGDDKSGCKDVTTTSGNWIFSGNGYPVWARFAERKLKTRGLWDFVKQGGTEGNDAEEDLALMTIYEMIDFKLAAKYGRADSGRKL